jgi:hypothetical protein
MILMSAVTISIIVVAVAVAAVALSGLAAARRRRRLRQRFGAEYGRLAGELDSRRKAESELAARQRRVRRLDVRPLTGSARAGYALQWAGIQEQFVDTPQDAVASCQLLVAAVMSELGYPVEDPGQMLADLSVNHAATLGHYRAAQETSRNAAAGTASTDELRLAMIGYRALFRDLTGESAGAENGSAVIDSAPVTGANEMQVADTRPETTAAVPVTDGHGQQLSTTKGT